ncbi:ImmA/IrrE family metallo-endopeptidase [Clostridium perfringens]|nr:ImmA/IrrE family metallo-endopeptidase [Clostridium perfringens]
MNNYEKLLTKAEKEGVCVVEVDFRNNLPCAKCKGDIIYINKNTTTEEKYCLLAEELGHYKLTVGNITKLQDVKDVKQELLARKWSYENLIPINNLIEALSIGINSIEGVTEYFNITESFFMKQLNFINVNMVYILLETIIYYALNH